MTTLEALALVALTVWLAPVALIFAWVLRDRSRDEQAAREGADVEWLTELTPESERPALPQRKPTSDCPIFADLAAERLVAELNDDAAVAAWLDGAK